MSRLAEIIKEINPDYKLIIDTIDNANNAFIDSFKTFLNTNNSDTFGNSSLQILNNINSL